MAFRGIEIHDGVVVIDTPMNLNNIIQAIFTGNVSTMTVDGAAIDIDADYTYDNMINLLAEITSWAGIGNEFKSLYLRASAAVTNEAGYLQGVSFISRVESGINLYTVRAAIFEVNLRAGDQEIDYVRVAEMCLASPGVGGDVVDETVTITAVCRILQLEMQLQSDVVPAENIGLWFEKDSASGVCKGSFIDMRLSEGQWFWSGAAAQPDGDADPWMSAPVGSIYVTTAPADHEHLIWSKHADTDNDTDWAFSTGTSL